MRLDNTLHYHGIYKSGDHDEYTIIIQARMCPDIPKKHSLLERSKTAMPLAKS